MARNEITLTGRDPTLAGRWYAPQLPVEWNESDGSKGKGGLYLPKEAAVGLIPSSSKLMIMFLVFSCRMESPQARSPRNRWWRRAWLSCKLTHSSRRG